MKNFAKIIRNSSLALVIVFCVLFTSCEPSIDVDYGQWGTRSNITNLQAFKLERYSYKVDTFYSNRLEHVEKVVYGVQRIFYPVNKFELDTIGGRTNAILTLDNRKGNVKLDSLAFVISHNSMKVTPLNDSPKPGYMSKVEANKVYKYQLLSADGKTKDWSITLKVNP